MKRAYVLLALILSIPLQQVIAQLTPYYQTEYLSYMGGEDVDYVTGVALDSQGNIIILGYTLSESFSFATEVTTDYYDVFIAKLSPNGALLFFKTLGGFGYDFAYDLVIDSMDNIWIAGLTTSGDFPVTYDAIQELSGGGFIDAFVTCFSWDGSLRYSSYLGGVGFDAAMGIAVDVSDSIYICGTTDSMNFPLAEPILNESQGMRDLFVAKIGSNRSELEFASYLGGAGLDLIDFDGHPLAVSKSGNIAITGTTNSTTLLDLEPVMDEDENDTMNGFVCVLDGTEDILWSSWILHEGNETGTSVCFDDDENLYLTGVVRRMVPTYISETQLIFIERSDVFINRYDSTNSTIIYRTIAGILDEFSTMISLNADGNLVVSGSTSSLDFPRGDVITKFSYGLDGFISIFNSTTLEIESTAFIGGADDEIPCYALMDVSDRLIVAGSTNSIDLEVRGEFQDVKGDFTWGKDAFVGIIVTITPIEPDTTQPLLFIAISIPASAAILMVILILRVSRKNRTSD